MNECLFFQVKTCFGCRSQGATAQSSWRLTISLLNYSPVSCACLARCWKGYPSSGAWAWGSVGPPLSGYTQLISGCRCHGLEMTGAGSPSSWQATAQITPLPERANALLMNNKSTLITNCQANQLAHQLSQTEARTAAWHYAARCPILAPHRSALLISPFFFRAYLSWTDARCCNGTHCLILHCSC